MKKLLLIASLLLTTSCATYKKIENNYYVTAPVAAIIKEAPQHVSGSDAQDSLNGNKVDPKLSLK